jgi:hypothetical protein
MRRDQLEHAIRSACQITGKLVKVQNANTAAPDGEPQYTGWCLDTLSSTFSVFSQFKGMH